MSSNFQYNELLNIRDRTIPNSIKATAGLFYWFAKEFSLEVIAVVRKEPEEEPSAEEVASLIQTIRKKNVHNIFIEPQFPARTAETIMRETGADIFMLDPVENGQDNPDAYLEIMNKNLEVLKKALAK